LLALCLILPFGVWLCFGDGGIVHLYRLDSERAAHLERIKRLAQENQALNAEVERLRTDIRYIEKMARRELGLVRENELIFRFSGDAGAPPEDSGRAPRERRSIDNSRGR
jgi:cell division protein FtsB